MSEKIKVGVIGLGMGRCHLEGYKRCQDAEIIAICDIDKEKIEDAKEEYHVP